MSARWSNGSQVSHPVTHLLESSGMKDKREESSWDLNVQKQRIQTFTKILYKPLRNTTSNKIVNKGWHMTMKMSSANKKLVVVQQILEQFGLPHTVV